MKFAKTLLLVAAFILVLPLSACGNSRETTAAELVSTYFDAGESDNTTSVLKTENYGNGFLALVRYTGSGEHLLLFKITKNAAGEYAITGAGEGSIAKDSGYSINVLNDTDQTILFGDLNESAGYKKINFTFEDDTSKSAGVKGAKAYILVCKGEGKIKDFTLEGQDNAEAGSYKDYVGAGNSITRTGFTDIAAK